MYLKRLCAWAAVVACLSFAGSAASAGIHNYVTGDGSVSILGVPEVGKVLTASGVPTGATCAWFRNGSTQISTSCVSYTVQAADVGTTISLQVKTAGITAFAALSIGGSCSTTGTVGTSYPGCSGIAASGGSGSYTYALSGAWPSWASINASTGAVSGTPTTGGSYPGLSVASIDSVGGSASIAQFTLTVSGGAGGTAKFDFSQASNSQYLTLF